MIDHDERAEYEAMCDKKTQPLREAVQEWARSRALGFSSRYVQDEHLWRFRGLVMSGVEMIVEIGERGEGARVNNYVIDQPTKKMIFNALNRWESARRMT